MNRRDFIKHIALLAAGAAALPEQIAAFEQYYCRNTPLTGEPFICIDDVWMSGLATVSAPLKLDVLDGEENVLPLGVNAFGGIMRWVAAPDQKIVVPLRKARWKIHSSRDYDDEWVRTYLNGFISYIDQDGIRVKKQIHAVEGSL